MTLKPGTLIAAALLGLACVAAPASATEETIGHYEALPSETLAEAVENFVTYNRKMQQILAHDQLSEDDLEAVHELTYTLEVALARMTEELQGMAVVLEEVHRASEAHEEARLRGVAEVYLEQARALDR